MTMTKCSNDFLGVRLGGPLGALMCGLLLGLSAEEATAQDRNPVQPEDYGQWESLGSGTLSQNGQWIAVSISRVSGENELRIHHVASDSVIVVGYGTRSAFSPDGQWIAYSIGKSQEEQDRITENDGTVRNDLGVTNLNSEIGRAHV